MKLTYLLPLPLFFAPFTQAADYLIRFKEGTNAGQQRQEGVSRLETFHSVAAQGSGPSFDYNANKLSLTVLSLSQAKDLARGKHHNSKSKAQVDGIKPTGEQGQSYQINSNGRWYTFDDNEFHIWHGDFTDEEVELLTNDAGVEMIEKDIVIQFPELQQYNDKMAKDRKVMQLNQALDDVEEQLNLRAKTKKDALEEEEEQEVRIPNSHENSHKNNKNNNKNKNKNKGKETSSKPQVAQEFVPEANSEDIAVQENGFTVQQNAPSWGLCRVSQRSLPISSEYQYPSASGEGVDAYVIDTGINIHHVDFEGRAIWGTNTVPGSADTDDNGHGTFVAGVIGSHSFGVAKKTNLIAVKGLNKDGTSTLSQILAALDWVIKTNAASSNRLSVVNLSLGAGYSKVLNQAVDNLVQSGLFIVAAAGNGNERNIGQNACNYSPASCATAFTVGSTNINDQISSFSNFGQCVNMYAPGERVRSTWIGPTNREVYTDSGTSFSAPNVAGIAALIMSTERGDRSDGSWSPKAIGNRILQLGTRNVVQSFKGPANTNILAYNGAGIIGLSTPANGTDETGGDQNSNGGNNDNGAKNGDDGNGWDPSSGSEPVKGGPSASSTTNHGPALSAIQSFTILSTIGSTMAFLLTSL
ncbi:hypothetical protein BGZ76_005861 [Entomortierella beljakovae]|nr:hypothetical protein BGZ76_005861 [Entomortierella beljakovae]